MIGGRDFEQETSQQAQPNLVYNSAYIIAVYNRYIIYM